MDKWVIVRPIWDDITVYSCRWAEEIASILRERGALVADLAERPVSREELEKILREHPEACVGFWDHGSEDCLWGGDGVKVLDLSNCELLANREVFTMACLSAAKLGVEVWNRGGKYWGYIEEFSFTTDSLPEFQEAANCGFHFRHVEGDTARNALARAKARFSELALQLANGGKVLAAVCMRNDGDILRYYNGEAPGEGQGCLTALLGLEIGRKLLSEAREGLAKLKGRFIIDAPVNLFGVLVTPPISSHHHLVRRGAAEKLPSPLAIDGTFTIDESSQIYFAL